MPSLFESRPMCSRLGQLQQISSIAPKPLS